MFRLIIWGVVIYILYRLVKMFLPSGAGVRGKPPARREEKSDRNVSDAKYTDIE